MDLEPRHSARRFIFPPIRMTSTRTMVMRGGEGCFMENYKFHLCCAEGPEVHGMYIVIGHM